MKGTLIERARQNRRAVGIVLLSVCCLIDLVWIVYRFANYSGNLLGGLINFWMVVNVLCLIVGVILLFLHVSKRARNNPPALLGAFFTLNSIFFISFIPSIAGFVGFLSDIDYIMRYSDINVADVIGNVAVNAFFSLVPFAACVAYLFLVEIDVGAFFCPKCGAKNPVKSKWCGDCGAQLTGGAHWGKVVGVSVALIVVANLLYDYFSYLSSFDSRLSLGIGFPEMFFMLLLSGLTLAGLLFAVRGNRRGWYIPVCFSIAAVIYGMYPAVLRFMFYSPHI